MEATLTRDRTIKIHSAGFIDQARSSRRPGLNLAPSRLLDELMIAFFVAMAVMWVVTAIAGIFG